MDSYKMRNGIELSVKMLMHYESQGKSEREIADILGITRHGLLKIRKKLDYRKPHRSDKGVPRVDPDEKRERWNAYMRNYYHKNKELVVHPMRRIDKKLVRVSHINASLYVLGRPLEDGEVVHHIDGDTRNNDPANLLVFASHGDHMKYHNGEDVSPVTE